ncbi:MAG: DNA translocase FtsK [Micavibrio sp.]
MTDVTPDDQNHQDNQAEKAGFKAAPADPLAAQEAVDRKNAARQEEASATAEEPLAGAKTTAAIPTTALPLSNEAVEEQTRIDNAQQVLANAQCLQAIAALFGTDDLQLKEYLGDISLVAQTENGLFLKGSDNEFTLSKDIIQAEQVTISAKTAFEMSILAFNNPAFEEKGVDLTGNLRDRYMLTLAANHFGLKVTNPVTDIPAELQAEFALVKAEWDAQIENPTAPVVQADAVPVAPVVEAAPVAEAAAETEETPAPVADVAQEEEAEVETPAAEEAAPVTETPPLDEHYNKAVELVVNAGKASKSFLQRSLHIGFNRASQLVEELEKQGVIGPADRAGKREVFLKPETSTPAPAPQQP